MRLFRAGPAVFMTLVSLSLAAPPLAGEAQAAEYEVCADVLRSFTVPPVFGTAQSCRQDAYCLLNPMCCTPMCIGFPDCVFWKQVEVVAGYIAQPGNVACFATDPQRLWDLWSSGAVSIGFDSLTPGLGDGLIQIASANIDVMEAAATPLPAHVKQLAKDIISPIYDNGVTGYEYINVDDVKIINRSHDAMTSAWLPEDMNAITLGKVIIMNDLLANKLLDANSNVMVLEELKEGAGESNFAWAMNVLLHELVHAKQYRNLGRDVFLKNYVMRWVFTGFEYGSDDFEQEAFSFEPLIIGRTGGQFCEERRDQVNWKLDDHHVSATRLTCTGIEREPVTNMSGGAGEERHFYILLPGDARNLSISITGSSGDADLYVRKAAPPTVYLWDQRPFSGVSNETVEIPAPVPGLYHLMVRGYTAFSGVTLRITYDRTDLTSGGVISGLSGAAGDRKLFWIDEPPGREYSVQASGGTGDADLYARQGRPPTQNQWNNRSFIAGNNELINLPSSATARRWYLLVHGFSAYSGLTLSSSARDCVPDCSGKDCGHDGCGGSCGSCGSGTRCFGGACICAPNCAGKVCGSDDCGGTCGACRGTCCDGTYCATGKQVCN